MRKVLAAIIISISLIQADPTVHTIGVGVRAFGMANNFTAVSNDFSASFWNPAGLAFIPVREVHFAMNGNRQWQRTSLDSTLTDAAYRRFHVNSTGLLRSVPTIRGGFAFAIGFSSPYQLDDLNYASGWDVFLKDTSIWRGTEQLPIELTQGDSLFNEKYNNLAYGQLNEWTASLGWQVAEGLGFGFTLAMITGTEVKDFEIESYVHSEPYEHYTVNIERTYFGYDARIGLLYMPFNELSIGCRLELPKYAFVAERYASPDFLIASIPFDTTSFGSLTSAFGGALGMAIKLPYITISSDCTFRAPFGNVPAGSALSYWKEGIGMGIEVPIRWIKTVVRAGYAYSQFDLSPFKLTWEGQPWDEGPAIDAPGQQLMTTGLSVVASPNNSLDVAYGIMKWNFNSRSHNWANVIAENHTLQQGSISLAIRY